MTIVEGEGFGFLPNIKYRGHKHSEILPQDLYNDNYNDNYYLNNPTEYMPYLIMLIMVKMKMKINLEELVLIP